jgi:hypothetical protein
VAFTTALDKLHARSVMAFQPARHRDVMARREEQDHAEFEQITGEGWEVARQCGGVREVLRDGVTYGWLEAGSGWCASAAVNGARAELGEDFAHIEAAAMAVRAYVITLGLRTPSVPAMG